MLLQTIKKKIQFLPIHIKDLPHYMTVCQYQIYFFLPVCTHSPSHMPQSEQYCLHFKSPLSDNVDKDIVISYQEIFQMQLGRYRIDYHYDILHKPILQLSQTTFSTVQRYTIAVPFMHHTEQCII